MAFGSFDFVLVIIAKHHFVHCAIQQLVLLVYLTTVGGFMSLLVSCSFQFTKVYKMFSFQCFVQLVVVSLSEMAISLMLLPLSLSTIFQWGFLSIYRRDPWPLGPVSGDSDLPKKYTQFMGSFVYGTLRSIVLVLKFGLLVLYV